MKAQPAFEKTPEFTHFTEVMKKLITVPKSELDQAMKEYVQKSKQRRTATKSIKKRAS